MTAEHAEIISAEHQKVKGIDGFFFEVKAGLIGTRRRFVWMSKETAMDLKLLPEHGLVPANLNSAFKGKKIKIIN